MEHKLPTHEWIAILVILTIFFTICLTAIRSSDSLLPQSSDHPSILQDPYITINIFGEVEKPGEYQVKKGVVLREVLEQAKPLPAANLSRYKLDAQQRRSRTIQIKKKKTHKR